MEKHSDIKISVIIPVFNMHKYISACLESVLNQSIGNIEVICVDDGSSDGSYEILREYERHTKNFIVLTQKREGPGNARNKGIETAVGEFVCMMDADDYYPDRNILKVLYDYAIEKNVLLCGGDIANLYPDGSVCADDTNFKSYGLLDSYQYPRLYGQTRFIYNREFLIKNNIRYLPYVRFEDPPFVLEAIMAAGKYYAINKIVYIRRTGYKKLFTNKEIAYGILQGIKRVAQVAADYNLKNFFNESIVPLIEGNFEYLFENIADGDGELWKIIESINENCIEYNHEQLKPFWNYKSFQEFVYEIKRTVHKLREAEKVIIYGAGIVAQKLLEADYLNNGEIIGLATSSIPQRDEVFGLKIRQIGEYKSELNKSTIVIAAGKNNNIEMEKQLISFGVEDYIVVTGRFLHIANIIDGDF